MENFLKFSPEAKAKLIDVLSTEAMKLFIEKTKSASDTGTFEMVITTDDIDRMGEMVKLDGWDTSHYMKSPVVLWGHNYGLMPVGVTDSLTKQGNGLVAKGRFAPTEMGQTLRGLYDAGMLKASSVGFMVEEQEGNIITKSQLLEWSFVSVPANPFALSLRELNVIQSEEIAGMVIKSISEKMKTRDHITKEGGTDTGVAIDDAQTQIEGNPCIQSEGGKPGTWKKVDGALVCMPNEASMKDKGAVADELTAEQTFEAKYANVCAVFDVVYAFCDVYFDESTPLADFNKLLAETVSLLTKLADGTTTTDDTEKGLVYTASKSITKEKIVALQSILASKSKDGSKGDDVDEEDDDDLDDEESKKAKDILASKKLLQDVATFIGESLGELKKSTQGLY